MGLKKVNNSSLSCVFIGNLIKKGYKNKSEKVFFDFLRQLKKENNKYPPIKVLNKNIKEISPLIRFIKKKVGGTSYEIPFFLFNNQQVGFGVRSFIFNTKDLVNNDLSIRLHKTSLEISQGVGEVLRKKRLIDEKGLINRVYLKFLD